MSSEAGAPATHLMGREIAPGNMEFLRPETDTGQGHIDNPKPRQGTSNTWAQEYRFP